MASEYQRQIMKLRKEKAELLKLRGELAVLRKEKVMLMKLRKEVRDLKQSPEVIRAKQLGKKALSATGKGLGKFFAGAYKYAEIATRPDKPKPAQSKSPKRKSPISPKRRKRR